MYLKDILIENVGPISRLDLSLPFLDGGLPKPVVFVGANGSGKTVVQSTIADALILMATPHFVDVTERVGFGHAFFKITGMINQRIGTPYGLSLLNFEHDGKQASYFDKTGTLTSTNTSALKARFPGVDWSPAKETKEVGGFSENDVKEIFRSSSNCFFPSTRRESPHWLNTATSNEYFGNEPVLTDVSRYSDRLNKPIFIERCREQNKQWILDVIFDSRCDVQIVPQPPGIGLSLAPGENFHERFIFKSTLDNINAVLRSVLNDPQVEVRANYRGRGPRLYIAKGNSIIIPSLDGLSLGQSLLFNLFCTIVRYSDANDLNKGYRVSDIRGIVIIDEIDAHLHTDLQYTVLPKLIKLFPKVQFIVSTHAPMFVLGMEREFGRTNYSVYELPESLEITTERFSEFERSFSYYKETKMFEDAVKSEILSGNRPMVILEGDTDVDYLMAYLKILHRSDLLAAIQIDWAGKNVGGTARSGGKDSLDAIAKTFRNKTNLLKTKLMLIYDCDCNKQAETTEDKFYLRQIPLNLTNTKVTVGIENLFPEEVIRSEFYDHKTNSKGETHSVFNKRKMCDWIIAQNNHAYFSAFLPIVAFLEELV